MMKDSLNVFMRSQLVGRLCQEKGKLSFQYHDAYLNSDARCPLSVSLPLSNDTYTDNVVRPFFDGLLPEDLARVQIARILKTDSRNIFALLKAIGADCAGAISVLPQNALLGDPAEPKYRFVDDEEAYHILTSLKARPLYIGEENFRVSGSGAQDKLVACIFNDQLALPLYGTPSTHLIKPNIEGHDGTVFNELFCMKLAKSCGLKAPECFVKTIKDTPFYVVERFDRECKNGVWDRIHQEDFCQMLHVSPENKYQSDGGPGLSDCFALLNKVGVSSSSKVAFLDLVIFNFLIGNGDAHAKNFSVLYKNGHPELAPCYDLICTAIMDSYYGKHRMAMKLCSSKYYMSRVKRENFEKLSTISRFRTDFILKRLDALSAKIITKATTLAEELNSSPNTQSEIYSNIIKIIRTHVQATSPNQSNESNARIF